MGALGRNMIKFINSYIFYLHLYVYIYVCTLYVFVCPLDTGRELDVQQDFQKSSRVSQERFFYVQNAGCFKGRYIYVVLIVDLNWLLLKSKTQVKSKQRINNK